jgi:hypothetical protein
MNSRLNLIQAAVFDLKPLIFKQGLSVRGATQSRPKGPDPPGLANSILCISETSWIKAEIGHLTDLYIGSD